MIKRNRLHTAISFVALLMLAACSQDELAEQGDTLPEGMYPLQIGSITLSSDDRPLSRVSENTDGTGSVFKEGDSIGVSLNSETAIYTYIAGMWTSDTPLYWKDTQAAEVTAWYPVDDTIDFSRQDQNGLTYLLKGTSNGTADYSTATNLTFTHQLAKVRVTLTGAKADQVAAVNICGYPTATVREGYLASEIGSPTYYPMCEATYDDVTCWEANIAPGTLTAAGSFQLIKEDGSSVDVTIGNDVTIEAGKTHQITIDVDYSPEYLKQVFYDLLYKNGVPTGYFFEYDYTYYYDASIATCQRIVTEIFRADLPYSNKTETTITAPWGAQIKLHWVYGALEIYDSECDHYLCLATTARQLLGAAVPKITLPDTL